MCIGLHGVLCAERDATTFSRLRAEIASFLERNASSEQWQDIARACQEGPDGEIMGEDGSSGVGGLGRPRGGLPSAPVRASASTSVGRSNYASGSLERPGNPRDELEVVLEEFSITFGSRLSHDRSSHFVLYPDQETSGVET